MGHTPFLPARREAVPFACRAGVQPVLHTQDRRTGNEQRRIQREEPPEVL
ncbi:MAG TPA: hypothetical protein VFV38_17050 [Ktedonobacteraceae bacterium]|nr:hypothetical protein [Ktedonobacteraceae bacterium]